MPLLSKEKVESLTIDQVHSELSAAKKVVIQLDEMKQETLIDIENLEVQLKKLSS